MDTPCDSEQRSDGELIEAANRGDTVAFTALYHRYRDWVIGQAYRWTGNQDDALDILQDTFAYLLGKLPDLRLTARMTTFLYPVVRNLSIRTREKQRFILLRNDLIEEIPAPSTTSHDELRNDLLAVMQGLSDQHREVVLLRFVDRLKLEEIAELLRLPLGTIKSRLHYALTALRRDERIRGYFKGDAASDPVNLSAPPPTSPRGVR